jgi:electron transport complex protein RnfD
MGGVLLALLPGIAVYVFLTGWGGILNIAIALVSGMTFEAIALQLRGRPVLSTLRDNSALVTLILIAICLPPLLPWWVVVTATAAAILLAKQAYGGLGQNIFNPAMVGYAVVLISYPLDVSSWVRLPEAFNLPFNDALYYVLNGGLSQSADYDALTGATALSQRYELAIDSAPADDLRRQIQGYFGARHSEWLNLSFLAGGLALLAFRIITWHLPVALLAGVLVANLLFGDSYPDIAFHWFGGATMLCAFFIITDPVSAPASKRARLFYGFSAGVLVHLIRQYGSYPDSIAFAVLLLNCCVPLIDRIDSTARQP